MNTFLIILHVIFIITYIVFMLYVFDQMIDERKKGPYIFLLSIAGIGFVISLISIISTPFLWPCNKWHQIYLYMNLAAVFFIAGCTIDFNKEYWQLCACEAIFMICFISYGIGFGKVSDIHLREKFKNKELTEYKLSALNVDNGKIKFSYYDTCGVIKEYKMPKRIYTAVGSIDEIPEKEFTDSKYILIVPDSLCGTIKTVNNEEEISGPVVYCLCKNCTKYIAKHYKILNL